MAKDDGSVPIPKTKDAEASNTVDERAMDVRVGVHEDVSRYTPQTFFRSVLFQMILFGMLSLVGPAMSDAISNLGGGGLASPWLANLANSLNYACGFFSTILGGPILNKIGIKWACFIAALAMPLYGSAYYVNARFHIDWYLLVANVIGGVTSGLLYVAETTAMLSYPKPEDRGYYLGIWSAMRNSGSVIGGAMNFSKNHTDTKSGGVVWATYLLFLGFECTGVVYALLLSPTPRVRRRDGSKVPMSPLLSWKQEVVSLWTYLRNPKTWLVFIPAFYSFFYGGTMGTYLSLHFSVRARALSSLLVPCIVIPCVLSFGKLLDTKRISQKRKAWIAFLIWLIPQSACFIWVALEYHYRGKKTALDYTLNTQLWAQAYFPYLIIFVGGYLTQLSLYWILGNYSSLMGDASRAGGTFRAFEVAGQAVSYGLSSASGINHTIPLYVNIGLLVIVVPSMVMLINKMPKTPMSSIVEEQVIDETDKKA
ncbi:hypothetical protein P3342_004843 [Pyrenophora teres f. teres]|uniref:MFS-1 multi-domain protein n=1 Tax=Pyrenophora teres f. teres TaxID=97479 RepID=A0A6S6VDG0_9PLEO|nr:hypothetical protein HRS9139_01038 [Pyrenophora teres f. teres]CAA9959598.1 hypothetical protein PTMSG1_03015 [Pyrenophora teres f. maculata]KAE8848613.1 hypothetical protein PTNB85_02456 [Pyrenophora teres f. teres]KAE8868538.1 hypothetical protein PTNB29_02449 [Pyrenophora teres f. teres]KAK1912907.1 hypothetical protein P3342_004843 [Pyrenophora teres f. teres]